jgi:uncharacterized protein YbjT (DUF2867 family)
MKFAVIGGTGLIGSRVVENLNAAGHQAVPHSLPTGVDIITGQGLEAAVAGADVVINLTNSPTFDDASLAFFQTSMDNVLAASDKAGSGTSSSSRSSARTKYPIWITTGRRYFRKTSSRPGRSHIPSSAPRSSWSSWTRPCP